MNPFKLKTVLSNSVSDSRRYAKEHCFEGSQVCPACPSYNSCVKVKMSVIKFWSNEIDRGTQLFWKKICPSATLSDRNITGIGLRSNTDLRNSRWNWSQ